MSTTPQKHLFVGGPLHGQRCDVYGKPVTLEHMQAPGKPYMRYTIKPQGGKREIVYGGPGVSYPEMFAAAREFPE